jgi:hypothetical protein
VQGLMEVQPAEIFPDPGVRPIVRGTSLSSGCRSARSRPEALSALAPFKSIAPIPFLCDGRHSRSASEQAAYPDSIELGSTPCSIPAQPT